MRFNWEKSGAPSENPNSRGEKCKPHAGRTMTVAARHHCNILLPLFESVQTHLLNFITVTLDSVLQNSDNISEV